uniref:Immunoglobulin V-set domain-containing protein n=1 Tax=Amphiprion ocellaris TaxID=80972 RepID=A0A3Q1BHK6_AMPOC
MSKKLASEVLEVSGHVGGEVSIRCSGRRSYAKYFCRVDDKDSQSHLIRTERHDQWEREGRFSLYDNTSGAFFIVRVDELTLKDTGTYWCGVDISYLPDHISVIQLNVTRNHHLYTFHPGAAHGSLKHCAQTGPAASI